MTSEERVRTALSLARPDRPPFAWWGHTYAQEWSPRALADVTLERQRTFGWDLVKLQPRASCFAEAFGSDYRRVDDGSAAPELVRAAVEDPSDWATLPAADASAPSLADQVETLRLVVDEIDRGVPVIQTVFSPVMVAGYLVGEDRARMARQLRERPDDVVPALDRIADALAEFVVRSVEAGAAGVFYAIAGFASADLLSAEEYDALVLPSDRRVLDAIPDGAWLNVLHLCGPRQRFDVAAVLGLRAVSWSVHDPDNLPLAEGLSATGRAVMGGIDRDTLVNGTPGEVLEQGRAAVESTAGVGLVLAPGCSVDPGAPVENLRAIGDSVGA